MQFFLLRVSVVLLSISLGTQASFSQEPKECNWQEMVVKLHNAIGMPLKTSPKVLAPQLKACLCASSKNEDVEKCLAAPSSK
jgi:hypothetical protein